ncbi:hypothetical protein LINPERPRIM_LOCUS27228 [Linum perenne]
MNNDNRWFCGEGCTTWKRLKAANIPNDLIEKGQNRVIDASLTLIRERAKLKVLSGCSDLVPCWESLYVPWDELQQLQPCLETGVPLVHSTNSTTEEGIDFNVISTK